MERTAKGNQLSRGERLQIMLDEDELVAVDDFRFSHRVPSRAAAVRELLKRGLAAEGWIHGKAGATSQSYGVLASVPKSNGKSGK
jgi:metal-responsive CopG/Arc/MetJ family transcriptional regulator